MLLVLEDLHWADTSTLDLVVFLAHNLDDRPVLLLATCRADEPSSAERMRRLADGVRRSGSALVLELGPLGRDELTALLAAHAGASLPAALADAIAARSEGNPFFAEELLAAVGRCRASSSRGALRDLLLQRVARLDHPAQGVLRLAAAAGREVGYPLLRATVELPDGALRDSLRAAVEDGVLVAEPETAASGSAMRCSRRRSTRPSSPGSARSCTRGSPTSSRAVERRERRSWHRTGRLRAARPRRSPRRSKPHATPRRSSASRRLTRTSNERSRSGLRCRTRPSSTRLDLAELCAWTAGSPATSAPPRARSSSPGGRSSSSARKTRTVRRSSM